MPNLVILGFQHTTASPFGWGWDDEDSDEWNGYDEEEFGCESSADYWLDECGQQEDGSCLQAGTKECDFECPFRRRFS